MPTTQTITVTVPDDAENPFRLVIEALERFAGQTYPILTHPIDADIPQNVRDAAIIVGEGSL